MKMKAIVVLLVVVVAVNGSIFIRQNVCEDESSGDLECCDGWTGSVTDGCPTAVCEESCVLYGGTCVSPDLCMNCPDDRFGVNCEKSQCQQERIEHEALGWADSRQMFKPDCLPDGSYALLQCHHVTRICHCVHRWTGEPYVNTYSRGVPDCTEYYIDESPLFSPKEVVPMESSEESDEAVPEPSGPSSPPCDVAHDTWSSSLLSLFQSEPQCAEDGYYIIKRCDYLLGSCICIDRLTGLDIEDSLSHSVDIDCTNIRIPEPEPDASHDSDTDNGCRDVDDGIYYEQDQSFYRDCRICTCHGYDLIQCTDKDCNTGSCRLGMQNKVIEHIFNEQCHQCICTHGVYECEMVECDQLDTPVEMDEVNFCHNKPPQTSYTDECNRCSCFKNGVSVCTTLDCFSEPGSCYVDGKYFQNGDRITMGCDTFRCVDGDLETIGTCADIMVDMVLTKAKPESACHFKDEVFLNGESMMLGYKMCKCERFEWDCQMMIDMTGEHQ